METGVSVDNVVTLEGVSDNGVSLDASIVLNGNLEVEDEEKSAPIVPTPKVLEMSCTAENVTDKGSDVQTYSSKLEEHSVLNEEGVVVTEKHYEESAIRTKSVKTEEGEVSTTSHILMKEKEKLHTTDVGTEVAEYNANCTEKHRSSVSSIETIGDQQVTRVKSSERTVSRNKTKVEEEGGEDTPKAITQSTQRDEFSKDKAIEKNEEAATVVHRRSSTTKSERCETKIIGGTGEEIDISHLEKHSKILQGEANAGALIDLGALGEIKLGSSISDDGSKKEEVSSEATSLSHGLDLIDMGSTDTTETQSKSITVDIAALKAKQTLEDSTTAAAEKPVTPPAPNIPNVEVNYPGATSNVESNIEHQASSNMQSSAKLESSSVTGLSTSVQSGSSLESSILMKSSSTGEGSSQVESNSMADSKTSTDNVATMATHVAQYSSQASKSKMAESITASSSHVLQHQQESKAAGVKSEVTEHAQQSTTGAEWVEQGLGTAASRKAAHTADYRHQAYRHTMAAENGEPAREESPSEIPLFKPNDRKVADDLVKRILEESRQEKSGKKKKVPTATLR